MKYCFHHWEELSERFAFGEGIFLALDYDGVLSPIASRPGLAKIPAANRRLLRRLSRQAGVTIAIVSGRELQDVRRLVGLSELIYAGNHGAEIQLNGQVERHIPIQSYRDQLVKVREELVELAERYPGAHVEDKGFGIGIHYREVMRGHVRSFRQRFGRFADKLPEDLHVKPAKMMFEVRPRVKWDKGSAVLRIWQQVAPAAVPICLGDDRTDEDGFRAIKGKGISIFVGTHQDSSATYYLESHKDVTRFLQRLLQAALPGTGRGIIRRRRI